MDNLKNVNVEVLLASVARICQISVDDVKMLLDAKIKSVEAVNADKKIADVKRKGRSRSA
jgi:hypothetical protein